MARTMPVAVLWLFIHSTGLVIGTESEQIPTTITQQELLHRLETRTNRIILKEQTSQEFVADHIPDAVNVLPTALFKRIETVGLYQDKEVVVYGEAGMRRSSLPLKIP